METTESILEQAAALLARVHGMPALDDSRLVRTMELAEKVGRLSDAVRVSSAAEVAERSRFELGSDGLSFKLGQRRPQHLIEQRTRVSAAEAARRMRLGALLRNRSALDGSPLPPLYAHVAEALTAGEIGTDAAAQITHHLQSAAERCAPDDLFEAEQVLVDRARVESADLVGIQARLWRDVLDADGAEPRDEDLRRQAEIRLGRERNGMTPIIGLADPIGAAKIRAMFNAYLTPGQTVTITDAHGNLVDCPDSPNNSGSPDSPDSPGSPDSSAAASPDNTAGMPADTRSIGQRQYDIFIGVITAGTAADKTVTRARPTIVATIRLDDYNAGRGVGWLDGVDEPISATHVRELGCDAEIRLLLFGKHGEVLALGHKPRLFNYAQRLAIATRDGGCIWPHCTAPPSWCDAHHVTPHSEGGPTDIDNGVLLCPAHHHMLHNSDMTLQMINGTPHLEPPNRLKHNEHPWTLNRSRVSTILRT